MAVASAWHLHFLCYQELFWQTLPQIWREEQQFLETSTFFYTSAISQMIEFGFPEPCKAGYVPRKSASASLNKASLFQYGALARRGLWKRAVLE